MSAFSTVVARRDDPFCYLLYLVVAGVVGIPLLMSETRKLGKAGPHQKWFWFYGVGVVAGEEKETSHVQ